MHESFFSYNLTRAYPYKWFTWVVGIGGAAASVFFSVLNLAANGYQLEVIYTTDPNGTLSETQWFQKPPWTLMNRVTASCQSQGLALNTQLFTTQLGLTYGLSNVWSYTAEGESIISPTLTYLNNTLENCAVNNILINAANTNTLGNAPFWAWQTTVISAIATCSVVNGESQSFFNMTVQYDASPTTDTAHNYGANGLALANTGFLHLDQKNKACLWWGQQLLHIWYYNALYAIGNYAHDENATAANTISTMKLSLVPSGITNITSLDFFNITGWFYMGDGGLHYMQTGAEGSVPMTAMLSDVDVGLQMHHFASVFYSVILSDLGQADGPNILTSFDLMQQYVLEGYGVQSLDGYNSAVTPAQEAFDELKATTGQLLVSPSTFNAQYICQVPHRRNMGSVLIAVLVADLVFLQALFQVLSLVTAWYLKRTDKQSGFCEGCMKQLVTKREGHADAIALLPVSPEVDKSFRYTAGVTQAVDAYPRLSTLEDPSRIMFGIPRKPVFKQCYERVSSSE